MIIQCLLDLSLRAFLEKIGWDKAYTMRVWWYVPMGRLKQSVNKNKTYFLLLSLLMCEQELHTPVTTAEIGLSH